MPTKRRVPRADSLTGARFVAAFLVFAFHVANGGLLDPGTRTADTLVSVTKSAGTMGVSFFFVLSGFVLTWSARPSDTYGGFLRRRLVKIFPNHLVTFCVALVLLAASTPPVTAVLNALLLQSWVPDPAVFLSVNGASWSLSCELLFYALFPLLLVALRGIPDRWLWRVAGGVAATVILLPVIALLIPAQPVFDPAAVGKLLGGESIHRMWFVYIFPLSRLLDFVLGIIVARIVLSGRWIGLPVRWAASLVLAGYICGLFTPMLFTADAVTLVPLALLVASLAATDAAGHPTVLASRTMRFLGDTSFAFYLVHGIVLTSLRSRFAGSAPPTPGKSAVLVLVGLAVSLILATALHRFVEMPAVRRWGRFRTTAPQARTAAPAEAVEHR